VCELPKKILGQWDIEAQRYSRCIALATVLWPFDLTFSYCWSVTAIRHCIASVRLCLCDCYFRGYFRFECLFWSKFSVIVDVKYYISTMHSPNCFCALTEAFVFLLMLLGLSDCRLMEKRNALLIVGTVLLRCLCVDVWNPT